MEGLESIIAGKDSLRRHAALLGLLLLKMLFMGLCSVSLQGLFHLVEGLFRLTEKVHLEGDVMVKYSR